MDLEKDVLRVADIMSRLAPRAQRYVEHVIERVGMSVATNTATNLIVFVLLTVELHGAKSDDFLRLMVAEITSKLNVARAQVIPPDDAPIH